jgi:hypothetical protein
VEDRDWPIEVLLFAIVKILYNLVGARMDPYFPVGLPSGVRETRDRDIAQDGFKWMRVVRGGGDGLVSSGSGMIRGVPEGS